MHSIDISVSRILYAGTEIKLIITIKALGQFVHVCVGGGGAVV